MLLHPSRFIRYTNATPEQEAECLALEAKADTREGRAEIIADADPVWFYQGPTYIEAVWNDNRYHNA